jgi:YYY domain-containing protein
VLPLEGEQRADPVEDAASQSANIAVTPEAAAADSVPPTVVKSTSLAMFLERYWKLALLAILVLAVVFRTRGLNWDEGQHLHPDERFLTMVASAIRIPASLSQYFDTAQSPLNPYNNNFGSFVYGTAPLFFVRLIGELVGVTEYGNIVLLGRALSALADVFVVAMAFAIGRRLYGLRIGLLAALLYAMAVLPIKQSHFFTVDTFTNVPLMLAFWFTLDIVEGKRGWRAFLLAGVCFGLMLASRINLAPFLGIVVVAGILRLVKSLQAIQHIGVRRDGDAVDLVTPDATEMASPRTRVFRLGPLLIEVEFKADAAAEPRAAPPAGARAESISSILPSLRPVIIGLVIVVLAAVATYRITQPYAFDGPLSLNPQFVEDMERAQRAVTGVDDYPPSHQWTNRTPYWFPWYNIVFWGFGPALGLTAWLGVGLAAYQLLRHRRWEHLLILLWVLGMFFYHGQQFVTTMRYFLPLYPFLAIFAAFFLIAIWDAVKARLQTAENPRLARSAQFFTALMFAVVLGSTLFWALASASIYTRTTTRVAASRWLYANVSDSEVLGNEHWDDTLPLRVDGMDYFRDHQGVMLELYGEDTPEKREQMVGWMDQVDYIILSSNRLYESIPRLPMRFPLTTRYYEWLFNGELGFEPVQEFTSYPEFLGITVNDDNAEEAFTVYDHPKVIIFKKTAAYSHDNTVRLFNSVDLTEVLRLKPIDAAASRRQFRMTTIDLTANRAGGTWSELFYPTDLANRFPVPVWALMMWLLGVLAFPITFVLFHAFADRGYAFAKALGILFAAWFAWTLSSYHLMPFGRLPVLLGLGVMLVYGVFVVRKHWQELLTYVRNNFKILLLEEVIFFAFFALALGIRYQNPDLWHPWLGGERPMDFAFLNAMVKTTYFPPYNPWFAGSYINYYYFGQLISAALIRLSGIVPEVAYNLLIPLFFALTASGAFGVVFNLVVSGQRRLMSETEAPADAPQRGGILLPGVAGFLGATLVLILGNLAQVKLISKALTELSGGSGLAGVIRGLNNWIIEGQAIPIRTGDWYWTATRVIENTINEFPFFTFLYGDLHAHLMAIPFTLLALGLVTHIVLSPGKLRWLDVGILALALGALRAINTWDYPTYLALAGAAIILKLSLGPQERYRLEAFRWHEWFQGWLRFILVVFFQIVLIVVPFSLFGIRLSVEIAIFVLLLMAGIVMGLSRVGRLWDANRFLLDFGWQFVALIILSVLFLLPYIYNYGTGYVSVELWQGVRTTFGEYITVHGIFLFLIATFLIVALLTNYFSSRDPQQAGFELTGWAVYFVPLLIIGSIALAILGQPILALAFPLAGIGLWIILHRRASVETVWITVLMIVGLLLTLVVEAVVLKGDVGRMNTVFKFYLQTWVMFGVAGAAGLGLIVRYLSLRSSRAPAVDESTITAERAPVPAPAPAQPRLWTSQRIRWLWWGAFSLLILAGLLYPISAARAKMEDRYVADSPPGLNGMDYMLGATYNENNQEISLRWDYDAIQWLRQNIEGSPVVMEANTGLYRWGNRYSIYTGLPTPIGWDWHTKQQYSLLPSDIVDYRILLVQEFYNTTDSNRALEIARRYNVSYVVVGGLERAVYNADGLSKFDQDSSLWAPIYQNEQVKIYQVR